MMHGLLEIFEQIKLARSSQRQGGFDFLFKLPVPLPESHQVHGRFETRRPRSGRAEDMFDAASRYLLCPLKRAVADVLLPQLDSATPSELCCWLILSDMYGVVKIREYCLDIIACNFFGGVCGLHGIPRNAS